MANMNRKMSTISLAQPHFKHKQSRRYYLWNKPLDGPVQNEILVDGGWRPGAKSSMSGVTHNALKHVSGGKDSLVDSVLSENLYQLVDVVR
jgi:hypothetical protein